MKLSKPTSSSKASSRPSVGSQREYLAFQRAMGSAIFRPLSPRWRMSQANRPVADAYIKPNDRLTSFDRLEIYNRQYWFRIIDCFFDDYPGLHAVLGQRKYGKLCRAYLAKYPSVSFTLRNLGQFLGRFLLDNPHGPMALDMARLEWARVIAFDGEEKPVVSADDLLDSNPDRLRLALQPYITLLELRYPLDDYLIALKRLNTEALRSEASNAVTDGKEKRMRRLRRPKRETIRVAVHRVENVVYYKRLSREQYDLLRALQAGQTLAHACARARSASAEDLQQWFGFWAQTGWFCRP